MHAYCECEKVSMIFHFIRNQYLNIFSMKYTAAAATMSKLPSGSLDQ
jgi:hypothetical protein